MGRQIREKENDKMDQFEMDKEDQRMEYQEMEYSRLEDMGQEKQDKEDGLMAERGMLPAEGREEKQDDTIWSRFSDIMKDIYGEVIGISTIVGVTVAAIALIIRMVSRNQRAVDEATNWLKRIVVTWIILNSLGFIVAYLQPLIAGGTYTGP